jgi:hypothetical protein
MAIKWADAPIETTLDFIKMGTAYQSQDQEIGKFPPEKDLKKWAIKVGGETKFLDLFTNEPPSVGETIKIRRFVTVAEGGEEKYPKWMLEVDYQKTLGQKKGFGGGGFAAVKPNLTPEQEIMDKAVGHAIKFFEVAFDKEGNSLKANTTMLRPTAELIYKIIHEAGKAAPQA